MATKVLLVSTNRCVIPDAVFPLGLTYLNAALRRVGYDTLWYDCQVEDRPLAEVLCDYRPDFVGISLRNVDDVLIQKRETYFGDLVQICEIVRNWHRCPVILGGCGLSVYPAKLLELSGADYAIQGEGELSFPSLLRTLKAGGADESIPGLVFRRGQEIVCNPPSFSILDTPLEIVDRPSRFVGHYLRAGGMLNVQTQRGCGYCCCYCTYPLIEGRKVRRRPPEAIAAEMARLQAQGARYVFVVDSVFNSSAQHISETCEAMLRANLTMSWGCFLRPQGLTPELMKLMARAGLAHIEFGTDSFCDTVLKEYDKGLTFSDIYKSSELAREAGLDFCHFLICGGPGETLETLEMGFSHSQRLKCSVILAVVGMRIYPGTTLHQRAMTEGRIDARTDLLVPTYYLAPGLTSEIVFQRLREFSKRAPNWIPGDPAPAYASLVTRLRSRGVVGPLWSYFAMLQRIMPKPSI